MAIRVFLCLWSEEQNGDLLYIKDPIDEALNNTSLSAPVVAMNYFARLSLAKRPDRQYMIKVMRGNLTADEWTSIGGIAGVRAVPPFRFDKQTSSIASSTKTKIYQALDNLGIPRTTFDSSATMGGFLRNMLHELDDQQSGFGAMELAADEWA